MRQRIGGVAMNLAVGSVLMAMVPAWGDVVMGWGDNGSGTLAQGGTDKTDRLTAVKLLGLPGTITSIAAGSASGYALDASGAVYAWGANSSEQLGDGTVPPPYDFSAHTTPQLVTSLGAGSGVTAIAAQAGAGMVIRNGGVYAWGSTGQGGVGSGSMSLIPIPTPVAAIGLTSGVTKISGGYSSGYAVMNGGLYSWGTNSSGQLGDGTKTSVATAFLVPTLESGVTSAAGGQSFALALKNGTVYAFGSNNLAQLGNGTATSPGVPALAAAVGGLPSDVTQIAAGIGHGLALSGNTLYAWGYNNHGQVGNGGVLTGNTGVSTPVVVTGIEGTIISIGAGAYSSYAITSDGALWVWGNNDAGQLGLGDLVRRMTPTKVTALAGYRVKSVASANSSTTTSGFTLAIADAITTTWTGTATAGNWTDATWTDGVPNSQVVHAVLSNSVTGSTQLTLAGPKSVGLLTIDSSRSYTLAPGLDGSLTFNNGTDASQLKVVSGSHAIAVPVNLPTTGLVVNMASAGSALTMSGGVSGTGAITKTGVGQLILSTSHTGNTTVSGGVMTVTSALGSGTGSLVVSGSGTTVNLQGSGVTANLSGLTVGSGSSLVVKASDRSVTGAKTLVTSGISLLGSIDLGNNNAVIHNGDEASIRALVASWWNMGSRNGAGLGSSVSGTGAGSDALATLAVVLNSNGTGVRMNNFSGVSVVQTDVLVKYTYLGDTDLNGVVDGQDLQNMIVGLRTGLTGWVNGDTNYDGVVDAVDYANLLTSMRFGTVSFSDATAGSVGVIPEPGASGVVGLVGLGMLARVRRRI